MRVIERDGDYGGYTIDATKHGWLFSNWSRVQGNLTHFSALLPYGGDFPRDCDLEQPWNDSMDYAAALQYLLWDSRDNPDAKTYHGVRILARGFEVQ